ncbi:MAG: isoprenyl transferase [Deltaproteobacteria bacterium]|nr:isoprenyl transferase [Deltaproteobacteria bacterium]
MILIDPKRIPRHVAIIMDGNGRWAKKRGLNRIKGHQKGADAVKEIVQTSNEIGVSWLTLYAFSEENWKRPKTEVKLLMNLLKKYLKRELKEMLDNGIRLQAIGRIEKLPAGTREILLDSIEKTASNNKMVLTLALSYGGKQEIVDAVKKIGKQIEKGEITSNDISEKTITRYLYDAGMPEPDLLIRTSGEYRISNFLLWQIAYTEIYITPILWPDFNRKEYLQAIEDYRKRERRFGGTLETDQYFDPGERMKKCI